MKIIQKFLQERIAQGPGKVNAPTFIYWVLHGKYPSSFMYGRGASHPEKIVNGIAIDKPIPDSAFKSLLRIKGIETRSSCAGESDKKPTFLIIRLPGKNENYVKSFVKKINSYPDITCAYDIGNEGQPRIGITTNLWYSKDPKAFVGWWEELPKKIQTALK